MRVLLALSAAVGLAGCVVHAHPVVYHRPPAEHREVVVTHVHDGGCGHYYYEGRWYEHQGHVHGAGCGHYYHGGRWVLVQEYRPPERHVCVETCNHYHHEGHWYVVAEHRHGAGCGHVFRGGMWIVIR